MDATSRPIKAVHRAHLKQRKAVVTTPNKAPTDDATLMLNVALFVISIVGIACLGPLVVVGGIIPWLLAWLFADAAMVILPLLAGFAVLAWSLVSGQFIAVIWQGFNALQQPGSGLDVFWAWLSLAAHPEFAMVAIAVGTIVSAALRLHLQDRRNALPYKKEDKKPHPAPIAQLRRRSDQSPPAAIKGGTVLGYDLGNGKRCVLTDRDANHHVLIVGSTGAGKTVSDLNVIESHILRGFPVVYLDGKGDIEVGRAIKRFAESQGRPAFLFHHHIEGEEGAVDDSCAYTPFSTSDPSAVSDMVMTLREWSEPHYEVLAKGFMQTVAKVAMATGGARDLPTVSKIMNVNAMIRAVRKNKSAIANAQELLDEIQDQRAAEQAGVQSLTGLVKNLVRSSFGPLLDTNSGRPVLRLADARENGGVAYFSLPALTFPGVSKDLGRLIINDLRLTLARKRTPWLIVLDEISAFAGPQMLGLVNQGRSYGARVVLAGQSFADVERSVTEQGPAFRNQILGSINTVIVHRLNSPDDAELGAQFAGTFLKAETTSQVVGGQPTGAGSVRMTREFSVAPDILKDLDFAEAVVISKSSHTTRVIRTRHSEIVK